MGRGQETHRLASSDEVVSDGGVGVEVVEDELRLDLVDVNWGRRGVRIRIGKIKTPNEDNASERQLNFKKGEGPKRRRERTKIENGKKMRIQGIEPWKRSLVD
ncbi:hypothetical protein U1Q18_034282 [Sarracenia purpurea var. burkii]